MLKDAVAWNSGFIPSASRERIVWQKDIKFQQAGSLCGNAKMTQIPLEVRAISGAYVAGKAVPCHHPFISTPSPGR